MVCVPCFGVVESSGGRDLIVSQVVLRGCKYSSKAIERRVTLLGISLPKLSSLQSWNYSIFTSSSICLAYILNLLLFLFPCPSAPQFPSGSLLFAHVSNQ
jgi:hypothetical protein